MLKKLCRCKRGFGAPDYKESAGSDNKSMRLVPPKTGNSEYTKPDGAAKQ